jgi:hypothetical protein
MSYVLKGVGDISSSQAQVMLEQQSGQKASLLQQAGRALEQVPIVGALFSGPKNGPPKRGGSSFPVLPVVAGVGLIAYLVMRKKKGK